MILQLTIPEDGREFEFDKHMLTTDMKAVLDAQKLCFAGTVSPDGKPNLSPKGVRIFDGTHLFICDMNSPNTVKNLRMNPFIELNVVDIISRRGYRFFGEASIHVDDEVYEKAARRVHDEGIPFKINSIILIRLLNISGLISPHYEFVTDEWEMRNIYKDKREKLDREFEKHLILQGSVYGKVR